MIKLDNDLLQELGLGGLSEEEKKKLLAHIYETLEMRVGMKLAEQMTDQQLREFEQFIDRNDEAGALRWLETNFPNYKDVVAAEFEKLKSEVRQVAPQIANAGQQPPAQPFAPQPQQMQQTWPGPQQGQPGSPPASNQWYQPPGPGVGPSAPPSSPPQPSSPSRQDYDLAA